MHTTTEVDADALLIERQDALAAVAAMPDDGVLNDTRAWFARFIVTQKPSDLDVLSLWTLHTYLLSVLPVSPRLVVDSIMPGSGKTTTLEHLDRLCHRSLLASAFGSAAMIPRMIDAAGDASLSLLIDEVDRTLNPAKEGVGDLLAVINSGYKPGGTRPVLVPDQKKGWRGAPMSTYAAIAMAGNSPKLPDDTKSRSIPIFLLPDIDGSADETDWVSDDTLAKQAAALHAKLEAWASIHAEQVQAAKPVLPTRCRNRAKERWVSFAKIAAVAGGQWPDKVNDLIEADLDREEAERADGINGLPPKAKLIRDLMAVFGERESMPTTEIVAKLATYNSEEWGLANPYGKAITRQKLAKMLSPLGIHSAQSYVAGVKQPRAYRRADIAKVADSLHLPTTL